MNQIRLLLAALLFVAGCEPGQPPPQPLPLPPPAHVSPAVPAPAVPTPPPGPQAQVVALNAQQLQSLGFDLPQNQNQWDSLPPQPGEKVLGKTVTGGPNSDTKWTAFTVVLFINHQGHYEVLTQMRAIKPVGVIETAGGHLTGGNSWRDGGRLELEQESGIHVNNHDLFYVNGGNIGLSKKTGELYGNVNFLLVLTGEKPATSISGNEVDKNYGHKWLDLETVYKDVKSEQAQLGFAHGKYYSFFRNHLIKVVKDVLKKKFSVNMLNTALPSHSLPNQANPLEKPAAAPPQN